MEEKQIMEGLGRAIVEGDQGRVTENAEYVLGGEIEAWKPWKKAFPLLGIGLRVEKLTSRNFSWWPMRSITA